MYIHILLFGKRLQSLLFTQSVRRFLNLTIAAFHLTGFSPQDEFGLFGVIARPPQEHLGHNYSNGGLWALFASSKTDFHEGRKMMESDGIIAEQTLNFISKFEAESKIDFYHREVRSRNALQDYYCYSSVQCSSCSL